MTKNEPQGILILSAVGGVAEYAGLTAERTLPSAVLILLGVVSLAIATYLMIQANEKLEQFDQGEGENPE